MATSNATLTLTFTAGTQGLADAKRDLALVDFAKANSLDIYQSDGVTIDNTKVAPAVRTFIATYLRNTVVAYRGDTAGISTRTAELTNLGTL